MIKPIWKAALGALAVSLGLCAGAAQARPDPGAAPLGVRQFLQSERTAQARALGVAETAPVIRVRDDWRRYRGPGPRARHAGPPPGAHRRAGPPPGAHRRAGPPKAGPGPRARRAGPPPRRARARNWRKPTWWRRQQARNRVYRHGRVYAPRRAVRRGRVLAPRYYRRKLHGPRFRYRHGPYRYFYSGWWYAAPWWLIVSHHYPAGAYIQYNYPVELDYDDDYGDYDDSRFGSYASGDRCRYWSDRCIENWGYRNPNYYGCLRYHGCD